MKNKVIQQHDIRDCGAACLAMVAHHYGLKISVPMCRELTKTDRFGTNLYGMTDGAEKIGLKGVSLSGSSEELLEGIRTGEIRFPFVAHVIADGSLYHFVVVFAMKQGKLIIGDPAKGKLRMSADSFFGMWTGYIVSFEKTENFHPGNLCGNSFRKFFSFLHGQYRKLFFAFVISLVVAAIGIVTSFVFEIVIDHVEASRDGTVSAVMSGTPGGGILPDIFSSAGQKNGQPAGAKDASGLNTVFIILVLLYCVECLIQLIRGRLMISISKNIDVGLSLSYYDHIIGLPVSSISLRQTGDYISRFSDAEVIRKTISGVVMTLFLDSVMVIGCGFILYRENSKLFFITFVTIAVYTVIAAVYQKPVENGTRTVMERKGLLQSFLKETVDGIGAVKSACAEAQIREKTDSFYHQYLDSIGKYNMVAMSQETISGTVEMIGLVFVLWSGFSMVMKGEMTIGSLMTFYALISFFFDPIKNLIQLQPQIQGTFIAADRLNDILEMKPEDVAAGQELSQVSSWEIRNVNFRYGNRVRVLNDISLAVKKGEKIAVVGESGCGKSSLAKLFLRYYEPENGHLYADGIGLEHFNLHSVRRTVAYVDQNAFFFADSIRNNILLGNTDVSDDEISDACRIACADLFIDEFPAGLDHMIEENGANLSGGQKQRLSVVRALLRAPQLLILDEATSQLDAIMERRVMQNITEARPDLACIIIAHRLSAVCDCDRIYVMKNGRIEENGTHEELLAREGVYADFWHAQH